MDSESLRTASTYLNNLLLARGLLRNGADIDFVKPSRESRAQIINLVHDLVLRSDRDKERNEQLSFSVRQLRAEDTRKNAEIERLRVKSEEHARGAVHTRTAERVAKEELKKVERSVKSLLEQVGRLKTSLAQVRTQCANDVKKRDLELARLKAHLQDQRRGNRAGVAAPTMTITGGRRLQESSTKEVKDPEYNLKQETTEFLTQLSQSLSDENDGLIGLLREALGTMKDLLGLPANTQVMADSAIGSRGSSDEFGDGKQNNIVHALPTSYETLATELDNTLSHLKKILTNPNFVSVDEVEVRDDEIVRLRQGWEHMEQRWKDVLIMMEGWRTRLDTGETLRLEDLQQGMGLVSPARDGQFRYGEQAEEPEQSFIDEDVSDIRLPDEDEMDESSVMLEAPKLADSLSSMSSSKRKRDVLEPPAGFDLRPPGTIQRSPAKSSKLDTARSNRSEARHRETKQSTEEQDLPEELHEAQMTLNEKLDAAAADAQAARDGHLQARAGDSAMQLDGSADQDELQDDDILGQIFSPLKKTKIRGRARRKSTLSREELAELLVAEQEE